MRRIHFWRCVQRDSVNTPTMPRDGASASDRFRLQAACPGPRRRGACAGVFDSVADTLRPDERSDVRRRPPALEALHALDDGSAAGSARARRRRRHRRSRAGLARQVGQHGPRRALGHQRRDARARAATGSSMRVPSRQRRLCVRPNAECLPFADGASTASRSASDCATSPTSRRRSPRCAACCEPGGQLIVLEFSQARRAGAGPLYDAYSFSVLPLLGQLVTGDAESYRYLAESIRRHPDQETLLGMMRERRPRGLPLPQPERRHRRRAPRLPRTECRRSRLPAPLDAMLNRGTRRLAARQRAVRAPGGPAPARSRSTGAAVALHRGRRAAMRSSCAAARRPGARRSAPTAAVRGGAARPARARSARRPRSGCVEATRTARRRCRDRRAVPRTRCAAAPGPRGGARARSSAMRPRTTLRAASPAASRAGAAHAGRQLGAQRRRIPGAREPRPRAAGRGRGAPARRRRAARGASTGCEARIARLEARPTARRRAAPMKLRVVAPAAADPARAGAARPRRVRRAPRTCTARCASSSTSRRGPGSSAARGATRGRAPAPRARGARADLREVRPGALHAPRPAAARHRRRARQAPGPRAAVPGAIARASDRARATAGRSARCSRSSTRRRWPPPRSPRCTSRRLARAAQRSHRQGAAPRHARDHRPRPRGAARARAASPSAVARRPAPAAARDRRANTRRRSSTSSTCMREAANASQLRRNFAGSRAALRAGGVLGLLPHRRAW